VSHYLEIGDSVVLIPKILNLHYITNSGAAFGILSDHRWIFLVISTLAVLAIVVFLLLSDKVSLLYTIALSMVAGGGIGNMIDRMFNGESVGNGVVIDFIDFCAFPSVWSYIFNLADSFVCVGAGLLVLAFILDSVRESRKQKAVQLNSLTNDSLHDLQREEEDSQNPEEEK
jgi:signal peptidase II